MKGTVYKRCACKDPDTGRPLNQRCPRLTDRNHGTWTIDTYLPTTPPPEQATHPYLRRRYKRSGYKTKTAAETALDDIGDLLKLADGDKRMLARIGDLIRERTRRGGDLPSTDELRRRLGAGAGFDRHDQTVTEWLEEWLAGKGRLKKRARGSYRQHMDHYLIPLLGHIPRDKLSVEHIVGMFDRIDEWNEELLAAKEEGRAAHLPDDVRKRPGLVGNATQHRILATLRNAYNVAVKRPGMINWNPTLAIELPPETRDPARVWSPEQVRRFLAEAEEHRLGLLYRIVLLRGLRRGEVLGIRWSDLDDDDTGVTIAQTVLELEGEVYFDTPKTSSGERWVSLDSSIATRVGPHRARQRRERLAAGEGWQEHGLMFCRQDGTPYHPATISWHFRQITRQAGLPPIKLHEGRHTAATLQLEAGIDVKVVSEALGHSTTRITQDLYQHVRRAVQDEAAEAVRQMLDEDGRNVKGAKA